MASVLSVNPVVKNRRVYHSGHREHRERIWQLSPIPVYGSARFTRSGVQLVLDLFSHFVFEDDITNLVGLCVRSGLLEVRMLLHPFLAEYMMTSLDSTLEAQALEQAAKILERHVRITCPRQYLVSHSLPFAHGE